MKNLWIQDMYRRDICQYDIIRYVLKDGIEKTVVAMELNEVLDLIECNYVWDLKVIWNLYRDLESNLWYFYDLIHKDKNLKMYKLKKDLLNLKAWDIVNIHKADLWYTRYTIVYQWHIVCEISNNILFNFDDYFEKVKDPKNIFELEKWHKYFTLDDNWYVFEHRYYNDTWDKRYIESWNAFLTKEEATKEVERRKAIQRVRKFMYENNIQNKEFKPYEHNYIILYNALDKNFFMEYYEGFCVTNDLWFFKTYDDCKKIINNCLNDLKIIFEVE